MMSAVNMNFDTYEIERPEKGKSFKYEPHQIVRMMYDIYSLLKYVELVQSCVTSLNNVPFPW